MPRGKKIPKSVDIQIKNLIAGGTTSIRRIAKITGINVRAVSRRIRKHFGIPHRVTIMQFFDDHPEKAGYKPSPEADKIGFDLDASFVPQTNVVPTPRVRRVVA